jgi:hypothetical protein
VAKKSVAVMIKRLFCRWYVLPYSEEHTSMPVSDFFANKTKQFLLCIVFLGLLSDHFEPPTEQIVCDVAVNGLLCTLLAVLYSTPMLEKIIIPRKAGY